MPFYVLYSCGLVPRLDGVRERWSWRLSLNLLAVVLVPAVNAGAVPGNTDPPAPLQPPESEALSRGAELPPDELTVHRYRQIGDLAELPDSAIEISGQLQFRYIYSDRAELDETSGFQLRRVKIDFETKVPGTDMEFGTTVAFNRRTGSAELNDATLVIPLADGFRLTVGQFRPPFLREQIVSSKRQLAVERSSVSRSFGQDWIKGIALTASGENLRGTVAVMDGSRTLGGDQLWQFVARGEWLLEGRWRQFRDFTSPFDSDPGLLLGAAVLYLDRDERGTDDDDETALRWTIDATVELAGTSFFAAVIGNHVEPARGSSLNQFGALVQGSRYVSETLELFARYEWGDTDDASPDLSILTVGANRYFAGHAAKLTADLGYAFSEVSRFWDSTGTGWLRDSPGEDGQVLGRVQMQILF